MQFLGQVECWILRLFDDIVGFRDYRPWGKIWYGDNCEWWFQWIWNESAVEYFRVLLNRLSGEAEKCHETLGVVNNLAWSQTLCPLNTSLLQLRCVIVPCSTEVYNRRSCWMLQYALTPRGNLEWMGEPWVYAIKICNSLGAGYDMKKKKMAVLEFIKAGK
jgi:hypothetical protein